MVAKISAEYRQKMAMADLMREQSLYEASHGNNAQTVNPAMTMDGSVWNANGQGSLGKQVLGSLGQKGVQGLLSIVKDLLLKGGPNTSLPGDAANDLKTAGEDGANTGRNTAEVLKSMDSMFKALSEMGISNEVIEGLKENFLEELEAHREKVEEKKEPIKKNNEKIKNNTKKADDAKTELNALLSENGNFTLSEGKMILGSEGYRSSFTMDKPPSRISGVGSSDKKERPKKERKTNTSNTQPKTKSSDKERRIKQCQQTINDSQTEIYNARTENQTFAADLNNVIHEHPTTISKGNEMLGKANEQKEKIAAAQNQVTGEFNDETQGAQNVQAKSTTNLADSTEDMADSALETVEGDALLVSGVPLIPIPATTAVGVKAEAQGSTKMAIGAASIGPSGMAMGSEIGNMVQQVFNVIQAVGGIVTMSSSSGENMAFVDTASDDANNGLANGEQIGQDAEELLLAVTDEEENPEEPQAA